MTFGKLAHVNEAGDVGVYPIEIIGMSMKHVTEAGYARIHKSYSDFRMA